MTDVPDNDSELTGRRRLPMGHQVMLGLGGLLAVFAVAMLVAIFLVIGLRQGETRLNDHEVPYASAVADAALNAKGIANDQRGFLLTGDPTFVDEADRRADAARLSFAAAERAAINDGQRQAVGAAQAGFERWIGAVHEEFAAFRAGDHERAIAASAGPDRELRKTYEQALAGAQTLGDSSVRSGSSAVAAASLRSVWILAVGLLVVLVVGAAIAAWLIRSVAGPLFRLVDLLAADLPL
ncbi:CHASE3 domain-containing protein [Actinoplanes sp. KI2]|uniref:CHASE3 domain-containing protein n=1 Tax=Actinoplanes sp. KI2 TaxID=2983315 RepID=UPI0021D5B5A0|nr:CHASE3 domain-containing protein [Actinoplanes sp. KI2]MCU7730495.1 CHASE3 domain-containing protein [Actinoplanes sp. KI2]